MRSPSATRAGAGVTSLEAVPEGAPAGVTRFPVVAYRLVRIRLATWAEGALRWRDELPGGGGAALEKEAAASR